MEERRERRGGDRAVERGYEAIGWDRGEDGRVWERGEGEERGYALN